MEESTEAYALSYTGIHMFAISKEQVSLLTSKLLITLKILAGVPHLISAWLCMHLLSSHLRTFFCRSHESCQAWGCCQAQAGVAACTLLLCSPPACRGVGAGLPPPSHSDLSLPMETHHQGCQLVPTGAYWAMSRPCCCAIAGKWKQLVPAVLLGFFSPLFSSIIVW